MLASNPITVASDAGLKAHEEHIIIINSSNIHLFVAREYCQNFRNFRQNIYDQAEKAPQDRKDAAQSTIDSTKIIEGYITNCIIGEITKENLLKKLFEARFSFLSSRRDIIKITRENIQKKRYYLYNLCPNQT